MAMFAGGHLLVEVGTLLTRCTCDQLQEINDG